MDGWRRRGTERAGKGDKGQGKAIREDTRKGKKDIRTWGITLQDVLYSGRGNC
jgi:hypothetical protein